VAVDPFSGLPGDEDALLFNFMSILLAAAGLVLLIAGINVAAMLSARYLARGREMAVRAALGAGRRRLLTQLLTEILLLFTLGAAGGFVVAVAATAALERLPLPENIPLSLDLSPDYRVLAFAVSVSLLAGLVFGLTPALRAARKDISGTLRHAPQTKGVRRLFVSRTLIAGQLAASLMLLVAAGLFLRALDRGQRVDPGFDLDNVAAVTLEPESWGYDEAKARVFYTVLRERVASLGGVIAVSSTGRLPLMSGISSGDIETAAGPLSIGVASIGVDYFTVLRLPLARGRAFSTTDDHAGAHVAIVNETLARRLSPSTDPLGQTFRYFGTLTTVVGVARDAKYSTLGERPQPFAYFPIAQVWQPTQSLIVRTAADPRLLAPALQQAILSIDPLLPAPRVTTLRQSSSIVLLPQRAAAIVTGMLGGIGLVLASVGLYGILAFAAGQRTREMGIRLALGARRSTVAALMIREALTLTLAGIVIGLALSALGSRLLAALLFDVSPIDPLTFIGMPVLFAAVALMAGYFPARRLASTDPLTALRAD
jgi:predicted permease